MIYCYCLLFREDGLLIWRTVCLILICWALSPAFPASLSPWLYTNIVTAFVFLFLTALVLRLGLPVSQGLIIVFQLIVIYNVNFGIFNLIPIPPLDGSRVITAFLPTEWEYKLAGYERYSFIIFVLLFMSGAFGYILLPVQRLIMHGYGVILSALGLM